LIPHWRRLAGVWSKAVVRRISPITLGRIDGCGRRDKPLTADYVLIAITTLALARGGFKFGGWADTLLRR
jgi:hypothetical protein